MHQPTTTPMKTISSRHILKPAIYGREIHDWKLVDSDRDFWYPISSESVPLLSRVWNQMYRRSCFFQVNLFSPRMDHPYNGLQAGW